MPLRWRRLYRQRTLLMQSLLSCKGPVPPRVSSLQRRETLTSCSQLFTVLVQGAWTFSG